jgi:hypothetical protein
MRQHTSPGGRLSREVSTWICRVQPPLAGTRRVTCRSVTVWPLRGPPLMVSSTVVPGQVVLVTAAEVVGARDRDEPIGGNVGGRALAPSEQVKPGGGDVCEQRRGPAAPVKAHRRPPVFVTMARSWGSKRRSSPARESDGSAITMNTGSPS